MKGFRARRASAGFTLLELLVVIGVVALLAALLLPAISGAKQKAQGIYCLNNGKQLITAVSLYAAEYNDFFPPNPDDGNSVPGHNWCSGKAGRGGAAEFNSDLLKDPQFSLLSPFLKGDTRIFRCPGDTRTGVYQGTNFEYLGKIVVSARTFSMNQAVGTICPGFDAGFGHEGAPVFAVNGPWLDNSDKHRRDSPWMTYGKFSTVRAPGPSSLWILIDENDHQLNDAAFAFGMQKPIWYDLPGQYHAGGFGLAFADGHSESHRFSYRVNRQGRGPWYIKEQTDFFDWSWMRVRTSANVSGTMPPVVK